MVFREKYVALVNHSVGKGCSVAITYFVKLGKRPWGPRRDLCCQIVCICSMYTIALGSVGVCSTDIAATW